MSLTHRAPMRLFTILLDYRGGTYIRQVSARSVENAIRKWARSKVWSGIPNVGRREREMANGFLSNVGDPVEIERTKNVWCSEALVRGHLAMVHVVETVREPTRGRKGTSP
jgi:hypothetical protein